MSETTATKTREAAPEKPEEDLPSIKKDIVSETGLDLTPKKFPKRYRKITSQGYEARLEPITINEGQVGLEVNQEGVTLRIKLSKSTLHQIEDALRPYPGIDALAIMRLLDKHFQGTILGAERETEKKLLKKLRKKGYADVADCLEELYRLSTTVDRNEKVPLDKRRELSRICVALVDKDKPDSKPPVRSNIYSTYTSKDLLKIIGSAPPEQVRIKWLMPPYQHMSLEEIRELARDKARSQKMPPTEVERMVDLVSVSYDLIRKAGELTRGLRRPPRPVV